MDDVVVLGMSSARHSCKVCGKGFPCGRSLGGHMRSHSLAEVAMADEADSDEDEEESGTRGANGGAAESGYGLRENPKKTRRLSGLDDDDDHGDRGETEMFSSPEPTSDDYAAAGGGEHDGAAAREDDEEDHMRPIPAEAAAILMPAPRRRRRSMRVPAPAPAPPPIDAFDREPEDVALCLIMLSRDTPARWAAAAAPATAAADRRKRNGGGYYHYHHHDSDDASAFFPYAADKIKQKRKAAACGGGDESKQRSGRYECPGCGRAFQSYQALGGHRASHKRINSSCCITTKVDHPEPSADDTTTNTSFSTASSTEVDRAVKAKRMATTTTTSKFECPICFKVFGSGQALGGHKRSHSIAGELYDRADAAGIVEPEQQSLVAARFLDLNLPAPGSED